MNPRNLPILFASLAALLGPVAAEAQTTNSLTLTFASGSGKAVNRQDCIDKANKVVVTWNFPNGITTDTNLTIFLSDSGSCPDAPTTAPILLQKTTITQNNLTNTVTFSADKLSPQPDQPSPANCPADVTKHWLVCAVAKQLVTDSFGSTQERVFANVSLPVDYDSQVPQAPTLNEPSAGDGTIYLSWTEPETVDAFIIRVTPIGPTPTTSTNPCEAGQPSIVDAGPVPTAPDGGQPSRTKDIDDGTVRNASVSGLMNEQLYELSIVAKDLAGNVSVPSNTVTATPKAVQDFYTRYRCEGGSEEGGFGCSAAGPALVPIAGLAALALLRLGGRRKE